MRPVRALLLNLLWVAALFSGDYVLAQDAIPETPPELRDFRLDPERSQPQPEPQPVTPPPVVSTVPDEQAEPAAPARTQPTRPRPEAAQPVASDAQEPAAQDEPEATAPTVDQAESIALPEPAPVATEAGTAWNYGLIGGIAGAVLLGLLGLLFAYIRRRQRAELAYEEPAIAPPVPALAPSPALPPVAKPIATSKPEPAKSRDLILAFAPEKATISFTTLTVRGQLQIANESAAMARDMQFRAGLVSASEEQHLAMQAFFADAGIAANDLGEAKPGEKLAMSIELTVPLTEMHSFPLGDQRLLVPIMVAELAYKAEDGTDRQVRIASMLGREARPPQPKMGPLRLDQGPRSFAPLGQRPLYA